MGCFKGEFWPNRDGLIEQIEACQNNRGNKWVVTHLIRIEDIETIHPAKEHDPSVVFEVPPLVELVGLQPICLIVILKLPGLWVEAGNTAVGADPQVAMLVFQNAVDEIIGQPVFDAVNSEYPGLRVEVVKAAGGPQPQDAAGSG